MCSEPYNPKLKNELRHTRICPLTTKRVELISRYVNTGPGCVPARISGRVAEVLVLTWVASCRQEALDKCLHVLGQAGVAPTGVDFS